MSIKTNIRKDDMIGAGASRSTVPLRYLSAVHVVENEVELLARLERVVQMDEERVLNVLNEHIPLGHHVLHLRVTAHIFGNSLEKNANRSVRIGI